MFYKLFIIIKNNFSITINYYLILNSKFLLFVQKLFFTFFVYKLCIYNLLYVIFYIFFEFEYTVIYFLYIAKKSIKQVGNDIFFFFQKYLKFLQLLK